MQLVSFILLLLLGTGGLALQGKYVKIRLRTKANGDKVLKAKCVYKTLTALPEAVFNIGFDQPTTDFMSSAIAMTDKTGNEYHVRSIVDIVPVNGKWTPRFTVVYSGNQEPQGSCSCLEFLPESTTLAPASAFDLPYSFPAQHGNNWAASDGRRFEAVCKFRVTESSQPHTKRFAILFDEPVTDFTNWVLDHSDPLDNSGILFQMVNMYWLNIDNLEVYFQATVYGDMVPAVLCFGDLPPYDDVTTNAPTTQVPTTSTPTTQAPTTSTPTTQAPTTSTPTTQAPTTSTPTTQALTTSTPTTQAPTTRTPTTQAPTTSTPTTQAPTTSTPTTQAPTTNVPTTNQPNQIGVPVVPSSDWNMGNNVRRFNGHCFFHIIDAFDVDELIVNITFNTGTHDYMDWSWNGNNNSPTGTWYVRTNRWIVIPGEFAFDFQVSYVGQSPPTGMCYANISPSGTTAAPPTTGNPDTTQNPQSTTEPQSTASPASTQNPGTTQLPGTTVRPDGPFNYNEVIEKSILFYRAQRSGDLPEVGNDPVPWRGDSALYDGNDVGVDLTGGWYDAGDWVKFNFPISAATAVLSWGIVQWKDGYQAAGQYDQALDSIKWSLDFFLKCWKPDQNILYGQVGNGNEDHSKMMRPEDMTPANMWRPAYSVTSQGGGSDLAGTMVAAFAAGAIAFEERNSTYAAELLSAAETLYVFADTYRAYYTGQIGDAGQFYPSSGYNDELVYAAAMLYKATKNKAYLTDAVNKYNQFGFGGQTSWAFDWSDKLMGAKLLLFEATGEQHYGNDVMAFLNEWRPESQFPYTFGGLAYRGPWGALRYSANTAFIALMAADMGINTNDNHEWAMGQIHYMLGDNPRQSSYVVGFGNNPPKRPHHKSSTCEAPPAQCDWGVFSADTDNAFTLYGALVGGPGIDDNYVDDRTDYIMAEVTCDYNAGFQSAVAGLVHFGLQ